MAVPNQLPFAAGLVPIGDDEVVSTRVITFRVEHDPGAMPMFLVNGLTFDPDRIDHRLRLGTAEEWIVTSATAEEHPFHIHTNPFQVIEIDGNPVRPPRWQDTVIVPGFGRVKIRTRYLDFQGKSVLHCHVLTHEDLGMMQAIKFVM
jgi:FtsP/CotA-like multicopper oxidase with cupredoxin domain